MWTLGDDDDVGTMLTSGLTRVKKDRDYCVKLDLIPLAPDLTLTGTGCYTIINQQHGISPKTNVTINQTAALFVCVNQETFNLHGVDDATLTVQERSFDLLSLAWLYEITRAKNSKLRYKAAL